MRVIAFTGLPGSGKSVAVEAVRSRGYPVIRMGSLVMEELARRGLPASEEHIGPVATGMRAEHGADIWARRTIERVRELAAPGAAPDLIAIDGVRSLEEIARFRADLASEFQLVAIVADETQRHARITARGRADDEASLEWAAARDARERGWGLDAAISAADHTLQNDGALGHLHAQIDRLLDGLLRSA